MKTTASTRKGKQARTLRSAVLISLTFLLCGLSTWSARAQSAGDWPVVVNDVDFNSAELRWPSANAALCGGTGTTTYTLRYRMAESGNWNSATTTGTTYALTGLESGAVYEVWLSGTCGANSLNYDHATFSTASTWKETPGGHLIFDSPNARIGIGTSAPVARLHVGGSLLAEGNTCPTPASGAGTRLMWVPSKAAFRAGEVTGTAWDSTNLGDHSLGFGFDAEASGANSMALGRQALATGQDAAAIGHDANAGAPNAFALGFGAAATDNNAFALGKNAAASDNNAFALGRNASASGPHAFALGQNAAASEDNAFALGYNAAASEQHAFALGQNSAASAPNAFALGFGASASDNNAFALGKNAAATGNNALAIGKNSEASGKESQVFGSGSSASGENAVVLGPGITSDEDDGVTVGAGDAGEETVIEINPDAFRFRLRDDIVTQIGDFDPEMPEIEIPEFCPTATHHFGPHYFHQTFTTEDGLCGGTICADSTIATKHFFESDEGVRFIRTFCQNNQQTDPNAYMFRRFGGINKPPADPHRLDLLDGANERIASFTQDGLTGLGVADLTHFKNADYRLYVDGKPDASNANPRAIYANGLSTFYNEPTGPYEYVMRNILEGAQADVDMAKAFVVEQQVGGAPLKERYLIAGSGATSINFETTGYNQHVIAANITGTEAKSARALAMHADGNEVFVVRGNGEMILNRTPENTYEFGINANILGPNANRTKAIAVRNNGNEKLSIWGNGRIVSEDYIVAKELIATLKPQDEVPDYVFADDYRLRPLSEVEAYVNEHSHLPGVPCAAEVKANGLGLAQMNLILLEKVEELTLYSIELEKRAKELEKRVKALEGDENEK